MTVLPSSRKLERESKADARRASSDEDGTTGEFHRIPFITTAHGNAHFISEVTNFFDLVSLSRIMNVIQ